VRFALQWFQPSDWLTHTPPLMVAQHLNIDPAVVSRFPNNKPEIMPE
jgi:oxalate decarboxylase